MRRMPGLALADVPAAGSVAASVGASAGAAVGASAEAAVGASAAGAAVGAAAPVGAAGGVVVAPPQAARIGTSRANSSASAKLCRGFNRFIGSKLLSQASVPKRFQVPSSARHYSDWKNQRLGDSHLLP